MSLKEMPKRRGWPRNEKAAEMYELYLSGRSLHQVALLYGCKRQSVYQVFKLRGWSLRPRPEPLHHVEFLGRKYSLRNNGYLGMTAGKRTLLHRDMWEFHNGKIPVGYDIHHIDGDKLNNSIENLECLPKAEHTRRYSPHNNQYTRGRKRSGGSS